MLRTARRRTSAVVAGALAAICATSAPRPASAHDLDLFGLDDGSWTYLAGLPTRSTTLPVGSFDSALTRFSGFTGCNEFVAAYVQGDARTAAFTLVRITERGCPAAVMEMETLFLEALAATVRYELNLATLVLIDAENRIVMALTRTAD